jgi:hypothetical protein
MTMTTHTPPRTKPRTFPPRLPAWPAATSRI